MNITQRQGGKEHPTYKKRKKAKWIDYMLRRNFRLEPVVTGKIEGTGR